MNKVWEVTVILYGTLSTSVLFNSEVSAEEYADQYRESVFPYGVKVRQVGVYD